MTNEHSMNGAAQVAPVEKRRLYPEDELNIPEPQFVSTDSGILLPQNALTQLWGPPGKGKSFIGTDWGLEMGQKDLRSVYVMAEKPALFKPRKLAWYAYHQLESKQNVWFYDGAPQLVSPDSVSRFIEEIGHIEPDFIILDTLARCCVGVNENDNAEMGLVLAGLETLQRAFKAGVIFIHHSGWNTERARGASSLFGGLEASYGLSIKDGILTLTCDKLSASKGEGEKFHYRIVDATYAAGKTCGVIVPTDECDPQIRDILKFIGEASAGLTAKELSALMPDIAKRTLYRKLSKLQSSGEVLNVNGSYTVTEK